MLCRSAKSFVFSIGLVIALAGVQHATATPLNVTANRQVLAGDAQTSVAGPNSPSTALGLFGDATAFVFTATNSSTQTASANQNSDVGIGQFAGIGLANVPFSALQTDGIFADSLFDVFFDITEDHTYSLVGQIFTSTDGGHGEAMFHLVGPTPIDFDITDFGAVPLDSSGTLAAGNYHLVVSAVMDNGGLPQVGGAMGGSSSFDFTFLLREATSSVSEPGSVALLGIALAGVGFSRRRKLH